MGSIGQLGWKILGALSLGLGIIGIFLPLLPTTPFVLLAAYAFQKGSPAIAHWLETHDVFGPLIENWRSRGAIPRSAKILACTMMTLSFLGAWYAQFSLITLAVLSLILFLCACYILSRPSE